MNKVYDVITDRICALMEEGVIPWQKPWSGGEEGAPANLISRKPYRGINTWVLSAVGMEFKSRYWLTFKQAKSLGGTVRKGSKGVPVVFWKSPQAVNREIETGTETGTGTEEAGRYAGPILRYYTVFNLDQIDGITSPDAPFEVVRPDFNPIMEAERVVAQFWDCPEIRHGGREAYYKPSMDFVNVPDFGDFNNAQGYYATLFHELAHSTGHEKRLGRFEPGAYAAFGSERYSKEELVAEMGATFLCGVCGIEETIIENSAAYVQGWLKALRKDKKMLIQAAAQAQKAADYILGKKAEEPKAKAKTVQAEPVEQFALFAA